MRSPANFVPLLGLMMFPVGCATTADFTTQAAPPKCEIHQIVMRPETVYEHTAEIVYLPDYMKAIKQFANHGGSRHRGEPARKTPVGPAKVRDFVCPTCSLEWEHYWASSRGSRTAYRNNPQAN